MPKIKNKIFVVSVILEGRKLYFVRSTTRPYLEGGQVLSQPEGIFSPDFIDARKYKEPLPAEMCASYFDGAQVECVSTAIKLKGGC